MVFCVLASSLGFFCNGWVIGSANLPGKVTHACELTTHPHSKTFPDCLPMNDALWGFAVSSFCIGGLMASLSGGYLQNKYGRKPLITYNSLGYIFGGLLIACATNTSMFIVGRIMCGYACGLGSLVIPIYICEISTVCSRGMMGAFPQGSITIGLLIATLIALPLSTVPLWRLNYALVVVPAVFQLIVMQFCVESPRYLVSNHRMEAARVSLEKLRAHACVEVEFYEMIEGQLGTETALFVTRGKKIVSNSTLVVEESKDDDLTLAQPSPPLKTTESLHGTMNLIEIFCDPFIRRIAFLVISVHMLQQLLGINAVMYYSTTIFEMIFPTGEMSKYMSIITVALNFISTVISVLVIDRMGRRTLLLISICGATSFLVLLVIGYVYQIDALLVTSVLAYVCCFAVGTGPIPWILTAELTPVKASGSVGSIATCLNWSMNFLVGQCFPILFSKIQGYSFIVFCLFGFLYAVIVYFLLPETKGRTLEDITTELKQ
ncbi:general substrate transporter [Pilaira anomala]|nr:general substrate transporter [Pilaira anomala]